MAAAEEFIRGRVPDIRRTTFNERGAVDSWWEALVEKQALMEAGDIRHEQIQLSLRLGGGGLLGVFHAGILKRLFQEGYGKCLAQIVGWSTGAAAGYMAIGSTDPRATEAYHEDVVPNKLVDGSLPAFAFRRVVRADRLHDMYGRYVDDDRVRQSPTKLFVGLTDRSGTSLLVDVGQEEDMRSLVVGSGAPPGITDRHLVPARVNGLQDGFFDGSTGHPVPTPHPDESLEHITHTLVIIPTVPGGTVGRLPLEFLARDPRYRREPGVQDTIRTLNERRIDGERDLQTYLATGTNVGVIAPASLPPGVNEFMASARTLKAMQIDAEAYAIAKLATAREAYAARVRLPQVS